MKAYYIKIYGTVQGVGFRWFTLKQANILNISGYVKNCSDGTVEALIQGNDENCSEMIEMLKKGPAYSSVNKTDIILRDVDFDLNKFDIIG